MSRRITVAGPFGEMYLTRQQAHILSEFGNPADPHRQSSECLSICGVREWPTCDNLIRDGLIERAEWSGGTEGWIYDLTVKGRAVLTNLRDLDWRTA